MEGGKRKKEEFLFLGQRRGSSSSSSKTKSSDSERVDGGRFPQRRVKTNVFDEIGFDEEGADVVAPLDRVQSRVLGEALAALDAAQTGNDAGNLAARKQDGDGAAVGRRRERVEAGAEAAPPTQDHGVPTEKLQSRHGEEEAEEPMREEAR